MTVLEEAYAVAREHRAWLMGQRWWGFTFGDACQAIGYRRARYVRSEWLLEALATAWIALDPERTARFVAESQKINHRRAA